MNFTNVQQFYMEAAWSNILKEEFEKPYMKRLQAFLSEELAKEKIIYPPQDLIFNAFCQTPFYKVKVVIIGQDPYHNPGQAHGLSFSVPVGSSFPPSLQNIYKELMEDVHMVTPKHGCLLSWAKQGVLLLNATLTVRAYEPKSHYGYGWEQFTDIVIQKLAKEKQGLVFILWGKAAKEKCEYILKEDKMHHLLLEAAHPSPLSAHAGFFGCKHFSKTNVFLIRLGKDPIDWNIS